MDESRAKQIIDSEFDFGRSEIDRGMRATLISLLIKYGTDEEQTVEQYLLELNSYKEKTHHSCDIYYDDVQEQFVCKLSNYFTKVNKPDHPQPNGLRYFREKKLETALKQAVTFIARRKPDNVHN